MHITWGAMFKTNSDNMHVPAPRDETERILSLQVRVWVCRWVVFYSELYDGLLLILRKRNSSLLLSWISSVIQVSIWDLVY